MNNGITDAFLSGPRPDELMYDTLTVERPVAGVVLARLNRPGRLNAITPRVFAEFELLQYQAENDPEVRVLLITGIGRAFCAGSDLEEAEKLPQTPAATMLTLRDSWSRSVAGFRHMTKPMVAALHGQAAGAGMALALAADIRIVSDTARFNAAFVRIGLSGGDLGTSWALPRVVVVGMALTKQVVQSNVHVPSLEAALALENRNQVLATRTGRHGRVARGLSTTRHPTYLGH